MSVNQDYLISVIVPVYNSKLYLKKCLDSLINQSIKELEIIVIDDGSTDGSSCILDKYAEQYPNFIVIHQPNLGQGPARNSGISLASGKYIGFVDSDDYVDSRMYEKLYSVISNTDADIAVCKANSIDMNGVIGKPLNLWNKFGDAVLDRQDFIKCDFLNNECSPVLWDKLIRSDIVKHHPSTDLRRGQDFVALIDYLSDVKRIAFTTERLYYYRHHPKSVMAAPESKQTILTDLKTEMVAISKIRSYFGDENICKLYMNRIITEWGCRLKKYPNIENAYYKQILDMIITSKP